MNDKWHGILASAVAFLVGVLTLAVSPTGPAYGHPTATMYLQFIIGALGLVGTLLLRGPMSGAKKDDAAPSAAGPSAGTGAGILLPLAFFAALSSGCAGWAAFSKCMKDQAPADGRALFAAVIAYATGENYLTALLQLGREVGPGTVDCVALALVEDSKANPKLAKLEPALQHIHEYLAARKGAGAQLDALKCGPAVVSTHPFGDRPTSAAAWFADGPPLAITVRAPGCDHPVVADVVCQTQDGETPPWRVTVPPGGEVRGLGQVMNRYAWSDPCRVE